MAALAAHFNVLPGEFILGDEILVERREEMRDLDLQRIFFLDYWSPSRIDKDYRALTFLTYALNYRLGTGALPFRAVNFGLNALVAVLVYFLLLELLEAPLFAALGSTLYAVLPIHTEAVAGILGRAEILAGLAVFGSWLLALKNAPAPRQWVGEASPGRLVGGASSGRLVGGASSGRLVGGASSGRLVGGASSGRLVGGASSGSLVEKASGPGRERPGLVLAAGAVIFFGLFTREGIVAAVPFLILATSWALRRPVPWLTLLAAATAVASYLAIRETLLEGKPNPILFVENPLVHADFATRALNSVRLLGLYLWKTAAPVHLLADYSYGQIPVLSSSDALSWILAVSGALLLASVAWLSRKRFPLVLLALLFFLLTMAPVANAFFPIKTIFSERLSYVPSLAFPLALCALLQAAPRARRISLALLGALLLAYGARSWARNEDWSTKKAMEESLSRNAAPSRSHLKTADELLTSLRKATSESEAKELFEKARGELEQVLRADPRNSCALLLYGEEVFREGERLFQSGKFDDAITCFIEAQRYAFQLGPPEFEPAVLQLRGECYLRKGKPAEALKDLDGATKLLANLKRKPHALVVNYHGLALAQLGKLEKALKDFDTAISLRSDLPELWNNRGFCRFKLKDYVGAVEDYNQGLELAKKKGAFYAPTGETVWSFLTRISAVYKEGAKVQRASGNEAAAKAAEAQAAELEAEARKLVPRPKAE